MAKDTFEEENIILAEGEVGSKTDRKDPRRKVRIPVLCWETTTGEKVGRGKEIITRDISITGIGYYSKKIYPIGTKMYMEIYVPGRKKPIATAVEIVRVEALLDKEEYIIGALYLDVGKEDTDFLAKAIGNMNISIILDKALSKGASDIHLTVGHPPLIRLEGNVLPLDMDVIMAGQVEAMLYPLISTEQVESFHTHKELDFAFSPNLDSRFRVNMHWQKGYVEAALRTIPTTIKKIDDIGIPVDKLKELLFEKSGLILIAGTTGAGKTTTMSAIVDFLNSQKEHVIITVEDPIEFIHKSEKCVIKQRELGSDTLSYAESLKRSLRQDPDIICVGELLDDDCVNAAMRAAETGHLVVTTLHAPSTNQAIERLVNFFPPEQAANVGQQLSSSLLCILLQRLLPSTKGGRVMASELLINSTAMKNLIRDRKYSLMRNVLQTGKAQGMYTLESSVNTLLRKGSITNIVAKTVLTQDQTSGTSESGK
jgi:twitching motility protein PilT